MEIVRGRSVLKRTAVGRLQYYEKEEPSVVRRQVEDTERELSRYERALEQAEKELEALYERALGEAGADSAAVFMGHRMLLKDEEYRNSVTRAITGERVNAAFAVETVGDELCRLFLEMEDEYLRARAADIRDVSDRLLRILEEEEKGGGRCGRGPALSEPVILAARDLAPSETVLLDKKKILGFVTEQGSANSHTAILARTMEIPALVSVPVAREWDGRLAAIDGEEGILYVDPDPETLERLKEKKARQEEAARLLLEIRDLPDVTRDGTRVELYANIGGPEDVEAVLGSRGAGVGLFRSEFLYLEKETYPTEDELFSAYRQTAERMGGREVVIRTLDIGADKTADYFGIEKEANPAMGFRALRICLKRPEIFHTQLRAIYRASAYGKVSVMFPMVASLWEVEEAKAMALQVREELEREGIPMGHVDLGIMIETPAAAILSGELAEKVDFFSIGTNDLTQYTLAADRQNDRLDDFYDPRHPAVLRLIAYVAENAQKAGIRAGICGELAADPSLTEVFLKMGIRELSVSPSFLLPLSMRFRVICLVETENDQGV